MQANKYNLAWSFGLLISSCSDFDRMLKMKFILLAITLLSTGTLLLGVPLLNNQAEFEEDEQCADEREECPEYAIKDDKKYCEQHRNFMSKYCPKSCGFCQSSPASTIAPTTNAPTIVTTIAPEQCKDKIPDCANQADKMYCDDNKNFMMIFCKKSCGFCEKREETEPQKSALSWVTGNWKPCENGIQERILQCYLKCGEKIYKVDISYCQIELEAEEPITKRLCE